jgi:putative transposase
MDREYFNNKYKTSTIRMNHWDYSWPAMYYVTICTQNRRCCLAEIKNEQVYLSEMGNVVFEDLVNIPILRTYVTLDHFIIMPNHLHAIFILNDDNDFGHPQGRDTVNRVSTERKFGALPPKSLSVIINTFKGGVTRHCHEKGLNCIWQPNYYEHVIRDYEDLGRIREYIAHNPINWEFSKNNPKNLK